MKISDLLEAEQVPQSIVVVGDSIGVGIGQVLKNAKTFATTGIGSAKIISHAHSANMLKPTVAIISAGSNDIVNGKGDPSKLQSNLQQIKSSLSTAKRIWILPYDATAKKVVAAVASGDEMIDLSNFQSSDHIHPSNYSQVVSEISEFTRSVPPAQATTAPAATQPTAAGGSFKLSVPPDRVSPESMDLQKVLVAFDFDVGPPGIDGIIGKYTTAAIKAAQAKLKLPVTGKADATLVAKLNQALTEYPEVASNMTQSTAADITKHAGTRATLVTSVDDEEIAQTNPLPTSGDGKLAKESADRYYGSTMSDVEWNALLRATKAESSYNSTEYAMVMASMLNRGRQSKYGGNILAALYQPFQFQAVTGTGVPATDANGNKQYRVSKTTGKRHVVYQKDANGHTIMTGPSTNFTTMPNEKQMQMLFYSAINILPRVSHDQVNFTANSEKAYGPNTNIGYRSDMLKAGGTVYGGTVFNTRLA
jgi:hypothetical protein